MNRVVAIAAAATLVALAWPLAAAVRRGLPVARRARRAVRRAPPGGERVLVVGDSTALGVGAATRRWSVAGRLASAHPEWTIGNLAQNGSRTADVARILARLRRRAANIPDVSRPYSAIVIHTGGNDALRFTSKPRLRRALVSAFDSARQLAHHTVLVMGGNLALAPAFPPPWSWLFGRRGRGVRLVLKAAADEAGVTFVDLYHDRESDPTARDPDRYFAPDGLHPSSAGYALWFHEIHAALRRAPRRPSCS